MKQVDNENYIYCATFEIKLYSKKMKCPDYVFKIPSESLFIIGALKYEFKQEMVYSEFKFIDTLSQRINFHLMPDMHTFTFDSKKAAEIQKKIRSINATKSNTDILIVDNTFLVICGVLATVVVSLLANAFGDVT